eukprot:scaffold227431_cov31-Tisochrysis_lutea.AAC.1
MGAGTVATGAVVTASNPSSWTAATSDSGSARAEDPRLESLLNSLRMKSRFLPCASMTAGERGCEHGAMSAQLEGLSWKAVTAEAVHSTTADRSERAVSECDARLRILLLGRRPQEHLAGSAREREGAGEPEK